MGAYPQNPFAPEYMAGLAKPPISKLGYEDRPFDYLYSPPNNQLSANQEILGDSVQIQTDADFELRGWYISTATGLFQIRLGDATGYQFSSGLIISSGISSNPSRPTVFSPQHSFPAGSRVIVDIQDLSGNPNTIQIVLVGVKRYRMGK